MKKGFRTPNLSKRVSSRTTGKLTRSTRSLTNPLYGKKAQDSQTTQSEHCTIKSIIKLLSGQTKMVVCLVVGV